MAENAKHFLSKSTYVKGLQCHKALFLYRKSPELRDETSPAQQAIFSTGTNVGILARDLFPGGKDASSENGIPGQKSIKRTRQLIDAGEKVIYEAAFQYDGVLVAVDILVRYGKKWKFYEVKSSTSVEDVHLNDAALQLHVLSNSGVSVTDAFIVHINNQYVRKGDLNITSLFTVESVFLNAETKQEEVKEQIEVFRELLNKRTAPKIDIGEHCSDPYDCDFKGHCWKHIPENSVFDISWLKGEKKFALYNKGIVRIRDIPKDYRLSANQKIQVAGVLENKKHIDKNKIKEFLKGLKGRLHFLDFETFNPAVPLFDNSMPYQKITFQYSLHTQDGKKGDHRHCEFLAGTGADPRKPFIERLLADIDESGDILVYNQAFEISCLKDLAEAFPKYAKAIKGLIARIKDLMVPFQSKHYYVPEMCGKHSIKFVLPALVPGMSYDDLEIQNGGMASSTFEQLANETDPAKIAKTRKDLLEYCKIDTLAMVEILKVLRKV